MRSEHEVGATKTFWYNKDGAGIEGRGMQGGGEVEVALMGAMKAGWGAAGATIRVAENQGDLCDRVGCFLLSSRNMSIVANAVTKSSKSTGALRWMETAGFRIQVGDGKLGVAGNGV